MVDNDTYFQERLACLDEKREQMLAILKARNCDKTFYHMYQYKIDDLYTLEKQRLYQQWNKTSEQ
ncbi:hypothetical protein H1220_04580 [Carnobacteriaceae bacterium zg-84]|uniref:hypothetical protein n=1 Tax=Granulicatella sp. zg-84 TaxID=2678503 RepID=UPI0013BF8B56|nr:hypothetical protein [Granulicatella sp. zg-84]NEW66670.1 hypothetical protein [Granulicatella sp. zg-84]QMI85025.1 hypothetical protein H1220_04580 [Carnobacteriaceae bacterium zg-84]